MGTESNMRRRLAFWRRRKQKPPAGTMTMMQHLGELRTRLVLSFVVFVSVSIATFFFYEPIFAAMKDPYCDLPARLLPNEGCDLNFFKVTSAFVFRLKLTALVALAVTSPFWLYQLYAFVVPALTSKEKRYTVPFILSASTLFLIGTAFAYLSMPTALRFLIGIGGEDLNPILGAEEYLNFIGFMLLGFGIAFELPLVLIFLGLVGVVSVEQLRHQRRLAVVGITALAAIVTPSTDPYTMLLMAIPLYGFYEITIIVLRLVNRRKRRAEAH